MPLSSPPPRRVGPTALTRLGVLAAIWGFSFLLIKVGLEGLSATQVVSARLLAGAAVLAAVVAVRRVALPRSPVLWGHLAVLGLLANVVPFFLFAWGEANGAPSGLAGVYNATTPLFTLVVAMAVLPEERPTPARAGGLALGFLGVLVVLAPWRGLAGAGLAGQLACLGAAACYGVAFVYTRRFVSPSGYGPLPLAAGQLGAAALTMLALAPFIATGPVQLSGRVVGAMLVLGALGTGVAYLVYYRLIADVGPTTASTVTYLVPIVAVALGVAVRGEPIGWNDFAGAAVVIAGVAAAEGRLRLPRHRTPAGALHRS